MGAKTITLKVTEKEYEAIQAALGWLSLAAVTNLWKNYESTRYGKFLDKLIQNLSWQKNGTK